MFSIVVGDVTPCTVVEIYRNFGGMFCFLVTECTLKMVAAYPSKAVMYVSKNAVRHIQKRIFVCNRSQMDNTHQSGRTGGRCVQMGTPVCFTREPVWCAGIFSK